jgi:putative mRNA 3-end processing factor
MPLIEFTDRGLYCRREVFISILKAVDKAVITHAHSDHAGGAQNIIMSYACKPFFK